MKSFFQALLALILVSSMSMSYASSGSTQVDQEYIDQVTEAHTAEEIAQIKSLTVLNAYFAQGPDGIYFVNEQGTDWLKLVEADPATFEVISGRFAWDKNNIYNHFVIIADADRDTFVVVSGEHGYSGDEDRIYGPNGVVEGADSDTFRMLNGNYALDVAHVYFQGRQLKGADAGSFEVLNENYARDAKNAYYLGKPISGADAETFKVIGLHRATDASGKTFFQGQDETASPNLDDLFEEDEGEVESPGQTDGEVEGGDETESEDETDGESDNLFQSLIKGITGRTIDVAPIHGVYTFFFVLLGIALLVALYRLFSGRMGESVGLVRSVFNVVGAVILSLLVFWLVSAITGLTGVYSPTLVFFFILFVVLLLFGIGTFVGWIKNILVSLLVIIIGAVVVMAIFFVLDQMVDSGRLLDALRDPLVFTDIFLIIGSIILTCVLYRLTTKKSWLTSTIHALISVIISAALLIISQNLFEMSGILWSVLLFHIFLFVMLFLVGIRTSENKIIHLAQVGRISFLHFLMMFVLFVILRIFLV